MNSNSSTFDGRADSALAQALEHSTTQDWLGHDKHDGLNSPMVEALFGWSRPTRLLALQAVMRFPVDIRPLLRVPRVANPKGLALFLQAYVNRYRYAGEPRDLQVASKLADRLDALRTPKGRWAGRAWGYQYPWQDLGFFAPRGTPNAVVTCFVCEALLDLFQVTHDRRHLDMVVEALPFLRSDLPRLAETPDMLCLGYMPLPMTMRVMDVSILIGALFARCAAHAPELDLLTEAHRLVRYVARQQTDAGAWWYTDPPEASPVRIDNYHTGFILDAMWRFMTVTGTGEHQEAYRKGLDFYAEHHFERDGAPRWMSDQRYPHDIHGSAQGVITFARHQREYPGLAAKIADWALNNLYDGAGRFWYRRYARRTDRRFYLRWNNGWMCRALSDLLLHDRGFERQLESTNQAQATGGAAHA